jgi:hypothetical protein
MKPSASPVSFGGFRKGYEENCGDFNQFFTATMREELRACGLLIL